MMFPQDALELIPQQQPFVMVDKLTYADESTAKSSFEISAENIFCVDGVFQEGGLLENMAQTAAAHSGFISSKNSAKIKRGFIGSVNNFEVFDLPVKGDVLITEVGIIDHVFDVTVISGMINCNGEKIASAELKIFIQE